MEIWLSMVSFIYLNFFKNKAEALGLRDVLTEFKFWLNVMCNIWNTN